MSENTVKKDLRTEGLVLRRTNYREADRILNILTPEGKFSVLARGVRKEKSRLAGGIEPFCLTEVNLHFGRGELATLTGAKMKKYYKRILGDLERLEFASEAMRMVNKITEGVTSQEYFLLLLQVFSGLDSGIDLGVVRVWFLLNFAKISGEEINFVRDVEGECLVEGERYFWDGLNSALRQDNDGNISTDEIKVARLMMKNKLEVIAKIKKVEMISKGLGAVWMK